MDESYLLGAAVGVIVMTTLGWMIGESRGRPGAGLMCGLFLGPLGVILALFLPRDGAGPPARSREAPVQRQRNRPLKMDPLEEFEERERRENAGKKLPPL